MAKKTGFPSFRSGFNEPSMELLSISAPPTEMKSLKKSNVSRLEKRNLLSTRQGVFMGGFWVHKTRHPLVSLTFLSLIYWFEQFYGDFSYFLHSRCLFLPFYPSGLA